MFNFVNQLQDNTVAINLWNRYQNYVKTIPLYALYVYTMYKQVYTAFILN